MPVEYQIKWISIRGKATGMRLWTERIPKAAAVPTVTPETKIWDLVLLKSRRYRSANIERQQKDMLGFDGVYWYILRTMTNLSVGSYISFVPVNLIVPVFMPLCQPLKHNISPPFRDRFMTRGDALRLY
jgi:hypothetical protein